MSSEVMAALLGALTVLVLGGYLFALREWHHAAAERDAAKGQRDFAMDELRESRAAVTALTRQLANVARAKNGLYREAIEDVQSHNVQAALRLRLAREELEAAERVLNRGANTDQH